MSADSQTVVVRAVRGGRWGRRAVVVGALGVCAYFGARELGLNLPWLNFSMPHAGPSGPPRAEAGVRQDTYAVTAVLDVTCGPQISEGVAVKATAPGWRVPGVQSVPVLGDLAGVLGDGKVDKVFYTDFLGCGDQNKLQSSASEQHVRVTDAQGVVSDTIQQVTVTFPDLSVVQPRVNELNPANCADLKSGDSKSVIDKKVADYVAALARSLQQGKPGPACNSGFTLSHSYSSAPPEVADALTIARAGAQLAVALDARPDTTDQKVAEAVEQIKARMLTEVAAKYPAGTPIVFAPVDTQKSEVDTILDRFHQAAPDIANRFTDFGFKFEKNRLVFVAKGTGGEEVSVTYTDNPNVSDADLARLNQVAADIKAARAAQ